jgi:hypothetical protein
VISPIGFDQPDNGHRVELLGAGRVIPRELMSGARFAAAIREQLADPGLAHELSRYRTALQGTLAIETLACGSLSQGGEGLAPVRSAQQDGAPQALADRETDVTSAGLVRATPARSSGSGS